MKNREKLGLRRCWNSGNLPEGWCTAWRHGACRQAPAQCWHLYLVARDNSVVEVFDGQCIVENIIGISSG